MRDAQARGGWLVIAGTRTEKARSGPGGPAAQDDRLEPVWVECFGVCQERISVTEKARGCGGITERPQLLGIFQHGLRLLE